MAHLSLEACLVALAGLYLHWSLAGEVRHGGMVGGVLGQDRTGREWLRGVGMARVRARGQEKTEKRGRAKGEAGMTGGPLLPGPELKPPSPSAVMAMKPENPGSGFRHSNVLAFINERMARHATGPQFYLENLTLSWEEVEDKFRAILEDHEMPSEALEACAWSSLALGVRFARWQSHLQRRRVQWLHDFARLHKSAAHTLASDLKQLSEQQEMERKEAAFQLRLARTKLTEVQRERDLLRWKLLQAVSCPLPTAHPSPQPYARAPLSCTPE